MAVTRISDVIVPQIFTGYTIQRTLATSLLVRSGIIVADPQIDALAKGAGSVYNMPYWGDLRATGRSKLTNDNPDDKIVPAKITAGVDKARKQFRAQAWSTMDLATALAGSDPMGAIADQVGDYWANEMQTSLITSLDGIVADNVAANGGDMVLNIALVPNTGTPAATNKLSATALLMAKQTMGDAAKLLRVLVVHSAVHTGLQVQNLVANIPNDKADVGFGTYLGYTLLVDDGVPVVMNGPNPVYTSYLFGTGAVAYGEGNPLVPVETSRDPAAGNGGGQETLYNRKDFIMHVRGIKWTGTNDNGISPTDAQLVDAANYERVYDRKAVRFVAIKSNG